MPVVTKTRPTKLTAIIEPSGEGFVIFCPELDLATQGETEIQALDDLVDMVIDYTEQYTENFDLFSQSPNRSVHLPYIKSIQNLSKEEIRGLFY